MLPKIAYLTAHNHPQSEKTLQILRKHFDGYEVVKVNIVDELNSDKITLLLNSLFTMKEYGLDVLRGKRDCKNIFFRTEYLFRKMRTIVDKKLRNSDFAFTFQIGSVFDLHFRDLPHFI